jgi:ATP-binding cassette subfamily B (MDR/TAP) protein 1
LNASLTGSLAGLKIANELRTAYFESILSQDVSFFDHVGAGEVAARSNKDINLIRVAFGERVGYIVMNLALIIAVSSRSYGKSFSTTDADYRRLSSRVSVNLRN